MKILVFFVLAFTLVCIVMAAQTPPQQHKEMPAQKQKEVHGQGCVEPGIEARCLVLKDIKTARVYSLIIKGLQPAPGEGIEFVAVPHNGAATCMQGTPLEVIAWQRRDQLNCRPVAPRRK
jgi:hypothetical protein